MSLLGSNEQGSSRNCITPRPRRKPRGERPGCSSLGQADPFSCREAAHDRGTARAGATGTAVRVTICVAGAGGSRSPGLRGVFRLSRAQTPKGWWSAHPLLGAPAGVHWPVAVLVCGPITFAPLKSIPAGGQSRHHRASKRDRACEGAWTALWSTLRMLSALVGTCLSDAPGLLCAQVHRRRGLPWRGTQRYRVADGSGMAATAT